MSEVVRHLGVHGAYICKEGDKLNSKIITKEKIYNTFLITWAFLLILSGLYWCYVGLASFLLAGINNNNICITIIILISGILNIISGILILGESYLLSMSLLFISFILFSILSYYSLSINPGNSTFMLICSFLFPMIIVIITYCIYWYDKKKS
jgi:hypothetical protein